MILASYFPFPLAIPVPPRVPHFATEIGPKSAPRGALHVQVAPLLVATVFPARCTSTAARCSYIEGQRGAVNRALCAAYARSKAARIAGSAPTRLFQ